MNMEPTNHPFGKENDLPNLHEEMFHVNLPGCTTVAHQKLNLWAGNLSLAKYRNSNVYIIPFTTVHGDIRIY